MAATEDRLARAKKMADDIAVKHGRRRGRYAIKLRGEDERLALKREKKRRRAEDKRINWWKYTDLSFLGNITPEREAAERDMLKQRGKTYITELKWITDYNAKRGTERRERLARRVASDETGQSACADE